MQIGKGKLAKTKGCDTIQYQFSNYYLIERVLKKKKTETSYCGTAPDAFPSLAVFHTFLTRASKTVRLVYRGEIIIKNMLIE